MKDFIEVVSMALLIGSFSLCAEIALSKKKK